MNEVEAVKAAIANTTDFDGDRMASRYADSELHAVALAAIAALDAARGEAEPVAWLYGAPRRAPFKGFEARASHSRWPDWMQNGWTETPLYAHPPRGDQVARVVEFIREQQANADARLKECTHDKSASHWAAASVTCQRLAGAIATARY